VFAHCTTICPLIVESIKRASPEALGAEVLLVTLDPWRDTVSALPGLARQWALPANAHVLSSSRVDDVVGVAAAFEVPVQRNESTGDVAHPGLVFLIDAEGRIAYVFNNPSPAWIREGLRRLG
jgi:cytochrome oxidase Cu insertion factor (SCO1/SenC/PrrC family)